MMRPVPRGTLALAGMAAGFAVGLVDGVWAAAAARTGVGGGVMAALLTAAVDGLVGGVGMGLVEVVVRWANWGRAVRPARAAGIVATVAVALAVGALTVGVAAGSVERRNRFLAAGIACVAALVAGVVAAMLAPTLARVLSRRRATLVARHRPDPALLLLLAPLVLGAVEMIVFTAVMGLRTPLSSVRATRRLLVAGVEAALLPALLLWAEQLPVRAKLVWAAPLAAILFVAPLVYGAAINWSNHLRFVPWTHLAPGLAIALVAVANMSLFGRALRAVPPPRRVAMAAAAAAVMMALTLATSESETARKVTFARAGLVGPLLAPARRVLDGDRDGYPRLLGGGDCDDGDALVHPGVLDFPDDGLDQDCDGKDASVAVLLPGPFAAVPETVPRDLNLLLVTIDTLRADHLGCYGYPRPTSPAIDALAAEGALFVNGWAHAPSTRYSMPAIATGRWPSAIAWDESIWWPRIASGVPTMAEALKALGYYTAAFYSYEYFSAGERRGFERGVDLYRADRAALHRAVNGPMESRGSSSREIADDTIAFLEDHRQGRFFLWIHFYDPHLSYETHAEVPSFGNARVDLYDAEIRFTDMHLGRVLARLRELDLWKRTAVAITGDHGEGFGEHGVTEHGFDLYAPQTKVPMIVRVPGLAPRRVVQPAGHVDLAPTFVNLARGRQNATGNSTFLGRSLVAEMSGAPAGGQRGAVFQEVTSERGKKRALATEDWHLIWNWTPDNTTECYDLRTDPEERRDVWGRSDDGPCRRLKGDLQSMVAALSMPPELAQKLKASVFAAGVAAPVPAKPLDAGIGELVKVAGFTLAPATGVVAPGHDVELAIHFECRKAITDGWRFFFHLMGPGGSFRNLDHVPVEGAMPLERWRPGQRIVDRVRIQFPPGAARGSYQVIAGLYRGNERLPINPVALSDGKNALRLATIWVP